MEYRRFGKTELQMPVITCGAMRFQHSWRSGDEIPEESQQNVEACILKAFDLGITHIETARGYGTSEGQIGKVLGKLPRDEVILQTKVGPTEDLERFKAGFEKSMGLLQQDYLDLFAFHGVSNQDTLDNAMKCLDTVLEWKRQGRIRSIGFSTHGPCDSILKAIQTGAFDFVNLHWFYIFQSNWPAIEEAARRDMGVFIISPNDKGGMLFRPSDKLTELTAPFHPMVFNGLFCLSRPEVHTLSCGVSVPEDFDLHMETVEQVGRAQELTAPIAARLDEEMERVLGKEWTQTWEEGLPEWDDTPGNIHIPWILRLRNLALAFDMIEYGKARYNMLGSGGAYFPGLKADRVDALDFSECLKDSPNADTIPAALTDAHTMLEGEQKKRLVVEEE